MESSHQTAVQSHAPLQNRNKQQRARYDRRALLLNTLRASVPAYLLSRGSTSAAVIQPLSSSERRTRAEQVRIEAARQQRDSTPPDIVHRTNGDEERYGDQFLAAYTKGLRHLPDGLVQASSYRSLTSALNSGRPQWFEDIDLGTPVSEVRRRLVNPQAGLSYELEGPDSHALPVPPPPTFASRQQA